MAGDFGVLVTNKFVLLDEDEGDPLEALKKAELQAKKDEKPKDKALTEKNKNVKKTAAPVQEKKPEKSQGQTTRREVERPPRLQNRPPSSQGDQRPEGERRVPRVPRDGPRDGPREFGAPSGESKSDAIHSFSSRGGYRGRGGRGGGGRGFGRDRAPGEFDRFGKREFERHSGSDKTGVKPVVKREGGGAHNWGQSVDPQWELQKASEAPADLDESADGPANVTSDVVNEEAGGEPTTDAAVDESANEMTLDEWKAANEKNRTKVTFNTRKPNEGHEDPKWKKMFILKKEDQDDEEEEEEDDDEDEENHHSKKNLVNIEITFGDAGNRRGYSRRGGAGRGGRGGEGRGRGRGGERLAGGSTFGAPHVDDQAEFPALGQA